MNEVFTYDATLELDHPYCQLETVAMAVRSPLMSPESVPPYTQLPYWVEDHPWPAMFRASTPLVSPRGSPLY